MTDDFPIRPEVVSPPPNEQHLHQHVHFHEAAQQQSRVPRGMTYAEADAADIAAFWADRNAQHSAAAQRTGKSCAIVALIIFGLSGIAGGAFDEFGSIVALFVFAGLAYGAGWLWTAFFFPIDQSWNSFHENARRRQRGW